GESTQPPTMFQILLHCTASTPIPTAANPIMAPITVWVVDTGQPLAEAMVSQTAVPRRVESMPYTSKCGVFSSTLLSTMPDLTVWVTSPPAKYAPKNSKIMATIMACLIVNTPEPTEVPMALATSLAPMPQAIKKPNAQASNRISVP